MFARSFFSSKHFKQIANRHAKFDFKKNPASSALIFLKSQSKTFKTVNKQLTNDTNKQKQKKLKQTQQTNKTKLTKTK